MDIGEILGELQAERDRLNRAIKRAGGKTSGTSAWSKTVPDVGSGPQAQHDSTLAQRYAVAAAFLLVACALDGRPA